MSTIDTGSGTVDYETVRQAAGGEVFRMSLTDRHEMKAVIEAVNQGIDAYLEACFVPDRGDNYEVGERTAGERLLCPTLECFVSPDSLPVLLRRLCEPDLDEESAGNRLATDILMVLGFDEYGHFVGREALGLA